MLSACGGGGGNDSDPARTEVPAPVQVGAVTQGPSPFIASVQLSSTHQASLAAIRYTITPRPGTASKPVDVTYSQDYLTRRGLTSASSDSVTLPVFGLYSGYDNQVTVELQRNDGSRESTQVTMTTPAFTDPLLTYDKGTVLTARAPGSALGFDFFYMKSLLGGPVIVDTDGYVRWSLPGLGNGQSVTFHGGQFVMGSASDATLSHIGLDGQVANATVNVPDLYRFHHNMEPGKTGLMGMIDTNSGGVIHLESTLIEFDPATASVVKRWDLADIVSRYMQAHGDDPAQFVRPGVDWFHMNAAVYDARDDSIVISSRENFLVKIDYSTGDLIWVFGDTTKYWHTFPSLAAASLTLSGSGLEPAGQHAVSVTHDGLLQIFDDGTGSYNQPAGQPTGVTRPYSAVTAFAIDGTARTATQVRLFDHGQSIYSAICSSAYESPRDTSMLVDYSVADNGTHARLIGLDTNRNVAFDLQFPGNGGYTAWNAQIIGLDSLRLD